MNKAVKFYVNIICILGLQSATVFAQKSVDFSVTKYCQNKEMKQIQTNPLALTADRIVVQKKYKKLYLMSGESIIKSYQIAMGPGSNLGPKEFEGDLKTPEGLYKIEFKNPKSNYYMALKISYPNKKDIAYAATQDKTAGSFIMIHGFPTKEIDGLIPQMVKNKLHPLVNWTQGCIAVTDHEIEDIYSYVRVETDIEICPN